MIRKGILLGTIAVILVALAPTQQAQTPVKSKAPGVSNLVLYDDFNGRWLDPAKWAQWSNLETVLHAVIDLTPSYQGQGNNRRLRMFQRANSLNIGDVDVRWGWLGLAATDPAAIIEIAFDIQVTSAAMTACPTNPNQPAAWAGFVGHFFKDENGNDVVAGITLRRDWWDDARAPLRVGIESAGVEQDLGFVSLGETVRLRLRWDQPNHRFIFQMNRNPEVAMTYGVSEVGAPDIALKALWVVRGTPDCTATPGSAILTDAYFDNVYVNAR